jgi:hypothetical protein
MTHLPQMPAAARALALNRPRRIAATRMNRIMAMIPVVRRP